MDLSDIDKFRDPIWRISNLYSIRTRDGKVIPFRPRPQQAQVLEMILKRGLKRIVILKARQLGFSTLLGIICADQLCWTTGKQLSLIDRTQENARQKLRDIVALAYDSLHDELKARFIVDRSNAGELGVRFHEYEAAQTSTLFAGTHARGGANSFLWISEWGFVQCEDLRRSEEILTGAIPSAKDGTIVVETTWRGGRGGHLWDIVKKALETPEEQKQPDDWRVVFFPWQIDNAYCDPEPQALSEETLRYSGIASYLSEISDRHFQASELTLWREINQADLQLRPYDFNGLSQPLVATRNGAGEELVGVLGDCVCKNGVPESIPQYCEDLIEIQDRRNAVLATEGLVEAIQQGRKDWRDELKRVQSFKIEHKQEATQLSTRKPSEILAMQFSPDDFLLESGYLAKGDPIAFCGAAGVGKSRLYMQLVIALVTGRDFLGWKTRGKGTRWLILQTENSNRRLKSDLSAMLSDLTETEKQAVDEGIIIHTLRPQRTPLCH